MASTTNLTGRWSYRTLANLFRDAARNDPVTVADGTQSALGFLDMGPNGYHATSIAPLRVVDLGGQPAIQLTGAERIDLPSSVAIAAAASDAQHEHDFLFYVPQQTMGSRYTIFSYGKSPGSSDSAIYDICLEANGTLTLRSRPQGGGTVASIVFGTWKFNEPMALTVARLPDGKVRVLINGADLGQVGTAATGTGNYSYATVGASRNNNNTSGTLRFIGMMLTHRTYGARSEADRVTDHAELYASRPTVTVPPSIAIDGETMMRAFSRLRSPVFPIAGSIANVGGTPAKLFTRIVKGDGSVVKPFVDTGAVFSFATATPTFSGGKVEDMPVGTGLLLDHEVRAADGSVLASIRGTITFMVGLKLLFMGSSTLDRFGYEYTGTVSAATGMHFQANPASTGGNYRWSTGTIGAGAGALMTQLFAATGVPVAVINAAVGGSSLGGAWQSNAAEGMAILIEAVARTGAGFDLLCMGAGANDSFKPYTGGSGTILSDHDHARKLGVSRDLILAAIGQTEIDTIVVGMNNRLNDTDQPIGSDGSARGTMGRGGEIIFVRSLPRALYVSSMDMSLASGDIHLTQGGQEALGTRCGAAGGRLANTSGPVTTFHPFVVRADTVADGIEITFQHVLGTDFAAQPAAGYAGFRVYDDLGALVADSENAGTVVTRLSATKLKVPFTVDPARAYSVAHQNGTWSKPQGGLVKDNTGLIAEPTISAVGEMMLTDNRRLTVTNV